MSNIPPIPDGFQLEGAPAKVPPIPKGFKLEATGEVVDGDTIRLAGDLTGRLFGIDAFERGQMGYRDDGASVNLGDLSADTLAAYLRPSQTVLATGDQTYGRPVVTMGSGWDDPVRQSLLSGSALAAPDYLTDDPERRARYLEDERQARLNRQGGHQLEYMSPDVHRSAKRWNLKLRPDEAVAFDSELPDFRPEFDRLTPQEEQDFFGYLASKSGDANFSQDDLDAYWKAKGRIASGPASPEFIDAIRKGQRVGAIDYSAWDRATLKNFNLAQGFAGLRPDVREAYGALLAAPESTPETLAQFADVNGLTFDPRDVSAFFAARARGENPSIPIPIINPGDGATGAGGRGFIDTLGFAGEAGGVVDAFAPASVQQFFGGPTNRETVWNSDRSFGDIWENNWRQNEAILDYDETQHPFARLGGQMVGGVFIPGSAGVRGASGFAKVGAVEGGIYGFGSADGDIGDRLLNVPVNAAGGAVAGATIGKTIDLIKGLSSRFARFIKRPSGEAADEVTDARRIVAFEDALNREVPDGATEITQQQVARAFQAADEAIGMPGRSDELPPIPEGFRIERTDMAGDDAAPVLVSGRVPDVIDVKASRTRSLGEGPSPDIMRAATARVAPEDVLPRLRDELSPEEAAQLGEGPYQPVVAPRERDYLETARYPSRANPDATITRKGPADLVTFVRSLNGIRDEGGELSAAGISNAARKGEDFAGGENRLGKLVNPEGIGLDEAADRAWREGYFPELDQPPTGQEFVAALDDTYRGSNRRFLPGDEAQIQAFEGARDQRLAVERSRQEGAPLAEDVGHPATYDDMVGNTPPPVDPDEWNPATLAKVGNVRVDKLDSPQEISRALKVGHDITGGFEASRRGVITQAETEALASDLGMTADQLLARRKGQAFNAEEALAARRILAASGNELVNLARRVHRAGDEPGSELLAAFRKAMVRHTAIQEQVSGMTAEAGRLLSQFRMVADSREVPGRVLEGLVNGGGGSSRLKEAAEAIVDLEADPSKLNHFVEKAAKPRFKDKAVELWYNFLLSGPQTHAVNILSNTMTSIAQIPEYGAAASLGLARRAIKGKAAERVLFSEVGARASGLLHGTKEGVREFARAFRTGEPSDFVSKVESQSQKAIGGVKGEVIRLPTRLLTAEDEFFKAIARRQALGGLSVRQAHKEGLKGEAAKRRASELMANPPDAMLQESMDYARYVTFQKPLGPVGSKISAITNDMPVLKAVLPFIRTPTNLIKFALERSPAAPMLKEWRKDFAAGGARRDIAIARATVGTGVATMIAELAAEGKITGSPPSDDNKRRLMMADGWQPYSFKIGDRYYSYRRLDPFAMTFGTAADIATLGEGMTEKSREEGVGLVVASVISNLTNKTWLSGMTDALEALRDPERYSGNFIERLTGSATIPTGVAQVARTIDPTMRETPDVASAIQSRVPGMSDDLLPKRDVWGNPITQEDAPGPNIISPLWVSTSKNDPITQEVLRVGAKVSPPNKVVGGEELSPEVYDKYQAVTGPLARQWLDMLIASPRYQALAMEDQADEIEKVMTDARKAARAHVLGGEPLPDARPEKQRRSRKEGDSPSIPAGFQLEQ